jgi:aminopeptidase N
MYGRDVYYKGAVVLHTLRSMIGADALETLLHEFVYPDGPDPATACRPVDTEAFLRRAEAVAGRSLDGFADTYLYRAALPRLDTTRADGRLTLRWTRTGEGAFEVPMPVRVGDSLRTVAMEGGTGTLSVPTGAEIQIDPTGWVLREKMTQAGAHQQRRRPVENR